MTEEEMAQVIDRALEEDDECDEQSEEAKQPAVALLGPEDEVFKDKETVYRCDQCGGSPKSVGELGECLRKAHFLRPSTLSKIRPF